jgi:hypothetical protein
MFRDGWQKRFFLSRPQDELYFFTTSEAGIQRPKTFTRPWIPASAGMTATERSENPNAIALPLMGAGEGGCDVGGSKVMLVDKNCQQAGRVFQVGATLSREILIALSGQRRSIFCQCVNHVPECPKENLRRARS